MKRDNLEKRVNDLEGELLRIKRLYDKAIQYQNTDPEVALSQARKSAEAICKAIFIAEGLNSNGKPLEKIELDELIQAIEKSQKIPKRIGIPLRTIQHYGNYGSHDQGIESDSITEKQSKPCLAALADVVEWYFTQYAPGSGLTPDQDMVINGKRVNVQEQKYIDLIMIALADNKIEPEERTALNQKLIEFGIPLERAEELEENCRNLNVSKQRAAAAGPENTITIQSELDWKKIVGKKLIEIRGGIFTMGTDSGISAESPSHSVEVTSFFIQKCPVTQLEYERLMSVNPSNFKGNPNRPVESVSWFDAIRFCNLWSKRDGLQQAYEISDSEVFIHFENNGYRLPTEAEWEYACRAGSISEFFWGDSIQEAELYSWFDGNSGDLTQAVGTKRPNPFGLYDMTGNIWEWTNDWYSVEYYGISVKKDPAGPEFGDGKVLRGGCWFNGTAKLRCSCRLKRIPDLVDDVTGFRCVARFNSIKPDN